MPVIERRIAMDTVLSYIISFFPLAMLICFIVSLIIFLTSPRGSQRRRIWKILTIVFGVIAGLAFAAYVVLIIILMNEIEHM